MKVRVIFYGGLKQDVGAKEITLDLPRELLTTCGLADTLARTYPPLAARLGTVVYAVNNSIVSACHPLHEGDEVGLLPPVSGG